MGNDRMDKILEKYQGASRDRLIPILQDIQEELGFLSEEAVVRVGAHLCLSAGKIYGVATFYNQFRFQPQGKFHIQVCRGTACHVKGSAAVLAAIEQDLKIKAGETDRKGLFSLEVVACIGACGLAPVISVNGEFHANLDPSKISEVLDLYRNAKAETLEVVNG